MTKVISASLGLTTLMPSKQCSETGGLKVKGHCADIMPFSYISHAEQCFTK